MKNLMIFEKPELGSVRVIENDGEPWFVASDVAKALGYENPSRDVQRHCKKVNKFSPTDSVGTPYNVIPESDVYRLVMRSNLPKAIEFQDWVVEEVLPAIRKTGGYGLAPRTYPEALRALAAEVEIREAVEQQKALIEAQCDHAIRTKAEIGSRREASAMATASVAVRQRDKALDALGEGETWKQVKAIPWLKEFFSLSSAVYSQIGKRLVRLSIELGLDVKTAPSSEYGTVKRYHVDAINRLHAMLMADPAMMGKYRRA